MTHALSAGHGDVSSVETTMRRLLSTASQPLALLDHVPLDRPATGGGLSYEVALKLYCDDPGVIGRLHAQFASRAALLLARVQEVHTHPSTLPSPSPPLTTHPLTTLSTHPPPTLSPPSHHPPLPSLPSTLPPHRRSPRAT